MSKKALYQCLKDRITTGATQVKTVGLYNSQFDNEDVENPFKYPAVFIEFSDINWEQRLGNTQHGDVTVTTHIGFESYKTEDLEVFDVVQAVHQTVNGFQSNFFTSMIRTEESQDVNHNNVQVWQTDYQTRLIDTSLYGIDTTVASGVTGVTINITGGTVSGSTDVVPSGQTIKSGLIIHNDVIRTAPTNPIVFSGV